MRGEGKMGEVSQTAAQLVDVEVTVRGLFLWVLDPDRTKIHLLMPQTDPNKFPGVDPVVPLHEAWLVYNAPGVGNCKRLEGYLLDLAGMGGSGGYLRIPNDIVNINTYTAITEMIKRKQLRSSKKTPPTNAVVARITLPAAGNAPDEVQLATVNFGTYSGALTHSLTWKVPNVDPAYFQSWKLASVTDDTIVQSIDPPVADADNVVRIGVYHIWPNDHDVGPGDPIPPPHFIAYYELFPPIAIKLPIPEFQELKDGALRTRHRCEMDAHRVTGAGDHVTRGTEAAAENHGSAVENREEGTPDRNVSASTYTCMMGSANPGPT
jgi:hypothetical protein